MNRPRPARILVIALGILMIFVVAIAVWGVENNDAEELTVVAYYNRYACGDDNIDMKVERIYNDKYKFLIDQDIAPVTNFFRQGILIDFVSNKSLLWQQGQLGEYMESFTLTGYLKAGVTSGECSSPNRFVVKKIKYGDEKQFVEF